MTQNERVLDYMKNVGPITQLEAITDLGVYRLASRISALKKEGNNIRKEYVTSENRFGEKVRFVRYSLEE